MQFQVGTGGRATDSFKRKALTFHRSSKIKTYHAKTVLGAEEYHKNTGCVHLAAFLFNFITIISSKTRSKKQYKIPQDSHRC